MFGESWMDSQDAPLARKQFLLHESEAAALIAVSGLVQHGISNGGYSEVIK